MSLLDNLDQKTVLPFDGMKANEILAVISRIITQKTKSEMSLITTLTSYKSVAVRRKLADAYSVLGEMKDLEKLEYWKTSESDRKTFILIETAVDRIKRREKGEDVELDSSVLSIPEALLQIKKVLGEKVYTIEGEITESKNYNVMYYFTVKDPVSEATLNCRCLQQILFQSGFPLNEGLQIRVKGKFVLDKFSRLIFDVRYITLTGEGELLRNLKLLQEKLDKEGLLDESRKRKLPTLPNKIMLIASSNSAALTDFTKVLGRRRGGITIYHLPIKTQGVGAESEIITKLNQTNELISEYDIETVIITRGGGSKEDLIVFNSESVVRAIHGISKPTIVAIGHERDISLAELVADVRASTPSQAAEMVSKSAIEVIGEITVLSNKITSLVQERVTDYRRYNNAISSYFVQKFNQEIKTIEQQMNYFDQFFIQFVKQFKVEMRVIINEIHNSIYNQIRQTQNILYEIPYIYKNTESTVYNMLIKNTDLYDKITVQIAKNKQEFETDVIRVLLQINSYNPEKIMEKGYAMVSIGNQVITTKKQIKPAMNLQIGFIDGTIEVVTK
jgi:exodeoxyribonuclease VII large subunit